MPAVNRSALRVTIPSDNEIVMTRTFAAPRELVFRAFTDPELLVQWWGQRSSTTVVDKFDLKPGGLWRYVQVTPNGDEYALNGEFREITPPERLVNTFEFEGMPGYLLVEATSFEENGGTTTVTSTSVFDTIEDRDGMLDSGMEAGAAESYDRLEELLATLQ